MRISVCVEGGGDKKDTQRRCRRAFSDFFHRAGISRGLQIVPGGGREDTLQNLSQRIKSAPVGDFVVGLVDSEGPVGSGVSAWAHLRGQIPKMHDWFSGITPDYESAYLMIQCMEAWFLADREELKNYFGSDFAESALPGNPDVEEIPKDDVLDGLRNATRQCTGKGQKGRYDKGQHSFQILGRIDPGKVTQVSPEARRLIETLKEKAGS